MLVRSALLDLVVLGLLIGQCVGRWGNFFNREAFGAETTVFCRMGLTSPSGSTIYVHPTFLYESLWNLALFIFLWIFIAKGKRKYNGQILLIYLFVYGIGRTLIEGLRTDSLYLGGTGIRVSQLLSAVLVIFAGVMLIYNAKRVKNGTLRLEPPYLDNASDEEDNASEAPADEQDSMSGAAEEDEAPGADDTSEEENSETGDSQAE